LTYGYHLDCEGPDPWPFEGFIAQYAIPNIIARITIVSINGCNEESTEDVAADVAAEAI
jgi:hypothetical protein